jgi:hypothetical protein
MPERQFHQLPNLCHLLSATTDVIVSNLIKITLLIFALDRLAFAVDDCILGNNAEFRWIDFDDFEFHLPHTTADCEEVALSNWSVCFAEIWCKENVEEGASKTFNCISDGEDGYTLGLEMV